MLRRKAEVFTATDGVVYPSAHSASLDERGADFSDPSLLIPLFPLPYRRVRISARDVELADATGSEVTAKVETRHAPSLTADAEVTMDGRVFEVARIEDRGRTCWLWLSEVATDGTCGLIKTTYESDAVGVQQPRDAEPVTVHVRRVSASARRGHAASTDDLRPALEIRVRAADYDGEQHIARNGRTYTVMSFETHGRWLDLVCRERGADRG